MVVWQGGAIDVSAAEAAAGALAEAAAGSVLEANGEELVVARLRGLPWSFDAVKVRRRTLTQRWEPLGSGLAAHCAAVSERGIAWAFCAGMPPGREAKAGCFRSRASGTGPRPPTVPTRPHRPPCLSGVRLCGGGRGDRAAGGGDDAAQRGGRGLHHARVEEPGDGGAQGQPAAGGW